MSPSRLAAGALALLLAAGCTHLPPAGPAALEREPPLGALRPVPGPVPVKTALSNGLPVLVVERPGGRLVSVAFVSCAGSGADPPGQAGSASLLLELVQAGAAGRSATALVAEASALGAKLEGRVGPDSWRLGLTVLPEHLVDAARLLSDVVLRPTLAPAELERLRAQRQAELLERSRDPARLADAAFAASLYGRDHPYGHLPEGSPASVNRLTHADLVAAHQRLGSAGAAVVVTGPLQAAEAAAVLEEGFGRWRPPAPAPRPPVALAPPGPRLVLVDRPGAPQSAVRVGEPGFARGRPDALALRTANNVLGGSFQSRLNANLRERHGWSYSASSAFLFGAGPGPFRVSTAVQTDATAPAVREALAELEALRAAPLSDEELDKARALLSAGLLRLLDSPEALAAEVAQLWAQGAPLDDLGTLLARAAQLDAGGVRAAVAGALHPGAMTVVIVGDAAKVREPLEALGLGPARLLLPGEVLEGAAP